MEIASLFASFFRQTYIALSPEQWKVVHHNCDKSIYACTFPVGVSTVTSTITIDLGFATGDLFSWVVFILWTGAHVMSSILASVHIIHLG